MTDQTTFINTYVDTVVEALHADINEILQLKTQNKILNNMSQEKSKIIEDLNSRIKALEEQNTNVIDSTNNMNQAINQARHWEEQYNTMVNKVSQIDALSNQFTELKTEYKSKIDEYEVLSKNYNDTKKECEELKDQIKVLSKQNKDFDKKAKSQKQVEIVSSAPSINKKETKSSAVFEKVKHSEPSKVDMKAEVKDENDDF